MTSCPRGFVIPAHPDSAHVLYINRTLSECAVSCFSPPRFTPDEAFLVNTSRTCSYGVGAVVAAVVVVIHFLDDPHGLISPKYVFVVTYGCVISACSIILFIMACFGPHRLCADSATPLSDADGMLTLCSAEGATLMFYLLFCAWSFCLQSWTIFKGVVLGNRDPLDPRIIMRWLLGVPFFLVLLLFVTGSFEVPYGGVSCGLKGINESQASLWLGVAPLFGFVVIGCGFSIGLLCSLGRLMNARGVRSGQSGVTQSDISALIRTSLRFIAFSGLYIVVLVTVPVFFPETTEERIEALIMWGTCVLSNFDGISDESWLSMCGSHSGRKNPIGYYLFLAIAASAGLAGAYVLVNFALLQRWVKHFVFGIRVEPTPYVELSPESASSGVFPNGTGQEYPDCHVVHVPVQYDEGTELSGPLEPQAKNPVESTTSSSSGGIFSTVSSWVTTMWPSTPVSSK